MNTTLQSPICQSAAPALATAALAYAAYGWSIIPVRKNKKAAVKWHKYQKRRPSPDEVKSMLSIRGVTGCAVILGKISGNLACRDFDKPGAYESWAAAHPAEAAHLPTVKTPRPGFHVYFTAENVDTTKFDDGELRGTGAYTLLPPSLHGETGKRYEWFIALNGTVPTVDPTATGLNQSWKVHSVQMHSGQDTNCTEQPEQPERTECPELPENSEAVCHNGEQTAARHCGDVASISQKVIKSLDDAIRYAVPTEKNTNHDHLWKLARGVLAFEKNTEKKLDDKALWQVFLAWHQAAGPYLRKNQSRDDYWFEFLEAREHANIPLGGENITATFQRIAGETPAAAMCFDSPDIRKLVALCRELQRQAGDKPFFLAYRTTAKLFGHENHTTSGAWLRGLVRSKILEVVTQGGPETNRATRYRYLPPLDD